MEAGRLKHRVTIQRPTRTVSPTSGEKRVAWPEGAAGDTVYAEVRPRSARERLEAAQIDASGTYVVSMRYSIYTQNLSTDDRLLFNGKVLNITGIINVGERNVEIQALATEA